MARIPYFDPANADDKLKETISKLPGLNIFRMMAHSDGLLAKFTGLGNHILGRAKLDAILREIAIIRVGVLSKASYEVHQHERIGRQIGMSDDLIKALHEGPDAAAFDDLQRLVMRYTDDVVLNVRASDATFDPLAKHLSHKEMQELTLTIGYYMMVSRFLETFDVDIEEEGSTASVDLKSLERK
jgi:alkylhydroperoxidase family enzyme